MSCDRVNDVLCLWHQNNTWLGLGKDHAFLVRITVCYVRVSLMRLVSLFSSSQCFSVSSLTCAFPSSLHLFLIPSIVVLVFSLRPPSCSREFVPCYSAVVPRCSVFVRLLPSGSTFIRLLPSSSGFVHVGLCPPHIVSSPLTGMFWFWFLVSHLKCTLLLLHCVWSLYVYL